jgi:hypothetical protein
LAKLEKIKKQTKYISSPHLLFDCTFSWVGERLMGEGKEIQGQKKEKNREEGR